MSGVEQNSPPTELPPLRIHHFMLWTAVLAVMLTSFEGCESTNDGFVQVSDNSHVSVSRSEMEASIPELLVFSVCVTGLLLGWYWKRKGLPFFDEPGQMAFILHGMIAVFMLFAVAIANNAGRNDPLSQEHAWLILVLPGGFLAICVVYLVLVFRYARRFAAYGRWGSFFFAYGVLTVMEVLLSIVISLYALTNPSAVGVNAAFFLVVQYSVPVVLGGIELLYWIKAIQHDIRNSISHHWTHWLGVGTWPAFLLASLIHHIILMFSNSAIA